MPAPKPGCLQTGFLAVLLDPVFLLSSSQLPTFSLSLFFSTWSHSSTYARVQFPHPTPWNFPRASPAIAFPCISLCPFGIVPCGRLTFFLFFLKFLWGGKKKQPQKPHWLFWSKCYFGGRPNSSSSEGARRGCGLEVNGFSLSNSHQPPNSTPLKYTVKYKAWVCCTTKF